MKIQQVATQTGLSIHTLRYYEQIGLVTPITRARNGHRAYVDQDIDRINFITRLRAAGMPLAQIKRYTDLADQGDSTMFERLEILVAHQAAVERKIEELHEHLAVIADKITYYRERHEELLVER